MIHSYFKLTYATRCTITDHFLFAFRDLLDLTKDNLQIREGKSQGIYLSGATEVSQNMNLSPETNQPSSYLEFQAKMST